MEMAKTFEKKVVIQFEGVRIVHSDELNFAIEKLIENEGVESWKHVGFGGTINTCLKTIYLRDILIDPKEVDSLESYIQQQAKAYEKIFLHLDGSAGVK